MARLYRIRQRMEVAGPVQWADMNDMAQDLSPERLLSVSDPLTGLPLAASGARARIATAAGGAAVALTLGYPLAEDGVAALREAVATLIGPLPLASFEVSQRISPHATQPNVALSPRVRNIIAVGSGKGGVGKSTTAGNLALALARSEERRVGKEAKS